MTEEHKTFNIFKLLPSMITLTALCLGISSIRLGIDGEFSKAFMFIVVACFLDGIDGRVARMLHATSEFGAQMDSFADFFNFGIAPGLVLYLWKMKDFPIKGVAWTAVLLLAIGMMLRLSRFNIGLTAENRNSPLIKYFFKGVPAPTVAGMVMLPAIFTIEFGESFYSEPLFIIINTIVFTLLEVSTIPTPAVTKIPIKHSYKNLILVILALIIIGMLVKPWLALSIMGIWYIFVIIIGIISYKKIEKGLKTKKIKK